MGQCLRYHICRTKSYEKELDRTSLKGQKVSIHVGLQWNPSIAATLGEQHFGRYIVVAFIEGLLCRQTVHLGPGFLAVIQRWPLFRGSTVLLAKIQRCHCISGLQKL